MDTISTNEPAIEYPTVGIVADMANEAYHAGPGVSKSGLWKLYSQTPAHFKYGEREDKPHFAQGTAIHTAIMEPERFETDVMCGPDDRRGNKWKDAQEAAEATGRLLLTSGDYDMALRIRDAVHKSATINAIIASPNALVEHSAFWIDEETGVQCRCRPDLVRPDLGLMLDLKSAASVMPRKFSRDMADFGYHAQEAFYVPGWAKAGGAELTGTVFLAIEKKPPFVHVLYELPPTAVAEGAVAMRMALNVYAECERTGVWPAYGEAVQELPIPRWAYKLTTAPANAEDDE